MQALSLMCTDFLLSERHYHRDSILPAIRHRLWHSLGFLILTTSYTKQHKLKSPGSATSRIRSKPLTPGGRDKVTQISVCIANKQMHDKYKDQLPLPQARWLNARKKEETDKEQGKTKHKAPRSVNCGGHRKGTTSGPPPKNGQQYTLPGGLKAFHCTNFTLGPDEFLNTKNA